MKRYIPVILFALGLAIGLRYVFTTNFLAVYDASRDYWLYNHYRVFPVWYPMSGLYGLQNTALWSSYLPAIIQWATHLPPELFFKIYLAIFTALVPVVVYLIAWKVIKSWYAVFPSLYTMGWVAFYQGGSFARLNFVVLLYGLLVLVILSEIKGWQKAVVAGCLAFMLPFAHYGGAIIALLTIGGCLAWLAWKRHWQSALVIGFACLTLLVSFVAWQGAINKPALSYLTAIVRDTNEMVQERASENVSLRDGQVESGNPLSVMSRDRVTQAALGVANPDNAGVFHLNLWLLGFAWTTVMLMLYGCWLIMRSNTRPEVKALVVLSLLSIGLTVLIPQVSRGYGLEKVYYQAIMVTGIGLVFGSERIGQRAHLPAWLVLCVVVLPYMGLMWRFGVIPSILG